MAKTFQWYYDGVAIGGATGATHTLTSGQTNSQLITCRVDADYGPDQVAAEARYAAAGGSAAHVQSAGLRGSGFSTTNTMTLPAGITDGNEIFLAVSNGLLHVVTTPSGWSQIMTHVDDTSDNRVQIFKKTASGDSSAVVTLATPSNSVLAANFMEASDVNSVEFTDDTAVGITANPPSHTHSGGSADTLWWAISHQTRAYTLTSGPAGYSNVVDEASTTPPNNGGGESSIASATLENTAASENPGAFTWAGGFNGGAITLAIR